MYNDFYYKGDIQNEYFNINNFNNKTQLIIHIKEIENIIANQKNEQIKSNFEIYLTSLKAIKKILDEAEKM